MIVNNGIKVVIFDLYNTVLKDLHFCFGDGMSYLYETFFKDTCSKEAFLEYEDSFSPLYAKRKEDGSEVCLIQDEIPRLFEYFGVTMPEDMRELEYEIMMHMQQETILEEVKFVLQKLSEQQIPMYILSNSIFTGKATERLLESFDILQYFEKVFASADYGVRKPSVQFFGMALEAVVSSHPECRKENILYVGNDYVTDVGGATALGLNTVWYNVMHYENDKNFSVTEVDEFEKIMHLLEK